MRKALVVAASISGLLLTTAAPAAAAAPVREKDSGNFSSLNSSTSECNPEGAGQTCTDIFLFASTDTSGQGYVSLNIETYSVSEQGEFTHISSEFGFSEGASLTVTSDFDAMLAETRMTLQTFTCTPESCEEEVSREVVVSASDTAVGPAFTSRQRGTFRDGTCTFRFSSTLTGAPVEGTITIDGVTYDETGTAEVGKYRVMQRCK